MCAGVKRVHLPAKMAPCLLLTLGLCIWTVICCVLSLVVFNMWVLVVLLAIFPKRPTFDSLTCTFVTQWWVLDNAKLAKHTIGKPCSSSAVSHNYARLTSLLLYITMLYMYVCFVTLNTSLQLICKIVMTSLVEVDAPHQHQWVQNRINYFNTPWAMLKPMLYFSQ